MTVILPLTSLVAMVAHWKISVIFVAKLEPTPHGGPGVIVVLARSGAATKQHQSPQRTQHTHITSKSGLTAPSNSRSPFLRHPFIYSNITHQHIPRIFCALHLDPIARCIGFSFIGQSKGTATTVSPHQDDDYLRPRFGIV